MYRIQPPQRFRLVMRDIDAVHALREAMDNAVLSNERWKLLRAQITSLQCYASEFACASSWSWS
jgi:hypothetical protein